VRDQAARSIAAPVARSVTVRGCSIACRTAFNFSGPNSAPGVAP
jgi:hypothetical protein